MGRGRGIPHNSNILYIGHLKSGLAVLPASLNARFRWGDLSGKFVTREFVKNNIFGFSMPLNAMNQCVEVIQEEAQCKPKATEKERDD